MGLTDRASGTLSVHQGHSFSCHGGQIREAVHILDVVVIVVTINFGKRTLGYVIYENSCSVKSNENIFYLNQLKIIESS